MIEVKSPGKLYIAGEYAVVKQGHKALLMSVDKFIKVRIKEAEKKGSIKSYSNIKLIWSRKGSKIVVEQEDDRFDYIFSAMKIVEKYMKEKGIKLKLYDIEVISDLETNDGIKYGLGSSAAIVVSIVKGLLELYKVEYTKLELFKLSVLANIQINISGSCGDIASAVYNGIIKYQSFSREDILKDYNEKTITEILENNWKYLDIKELEVNDNFKFLIGWTKSPASSNNLVNNSNKNLDNNRQFYAEFLDKSNKCVDDIVTSYEENDYKLLYDSVAQNRKLLKQYAYNYNIVIENEELSFLVDSSIKQNIASKTSGAGGGDCGIAIYNSLQNIDKLKNLWKNNGIEILNLSIYEGN